MSRKIFLTCYGLFFPFMYLEINQGLKLIYLFIPISIIFSRLYKFSIINYIIIVLLLILSFSYFIGVNRFGDSSQGFKLLMLLFASVYFSFFVFIFRTSKDINIFVNSFIFGFTVNSLINIYLYIQSNFTIARISSFWSIGYSETGLDNLTIQASFNEIGALTAIASSFCFIKIIQINNIYIKVLNIIFFFILLFGLFLTGSRSGLFGLIIFVLYYIYAMREIIIRNYIYIIPIIFLSVVLSDNNIIYQRIAVIFNDPYSNDALSATSRFSAWLDAINIFLLYPLSGCGYGFYSRASPTGLITCESFPFTLLAEAGILALTVYIIIFIYIFLRDNQIANKYKYYFNASLIIIFFTNLTGSILLDFNIMLLFFILIINKYRLIYL